MVNVKDQVISIIRNQKADILEKLDDSKLKFANSHLNDDDWHIKSNHEKDCKIYTGQISVLDTLEDIITASVSEVNLPVGV